MKNIKTKIFLFLLIAIGTLFMVSCEDKDEVKGEVTPPSATEINEYVNNWILDSMSIYYLWNDKLPKKNSLDFSKKPEDFFESLLYKKDANGKTMDRFSWLQPSYVDLINSLSGVSRDIGFEYQPLFVDENKTRVGFLVYYTKKSSSAETKGLKRGEIIIEVDGQFITEDNFYNIMATGASKYNLTVYNIAQQAERKIEVAVQENYHENPIYYSNIYRINDKKIGYIIYNFFSPDDGDRSYKYDIELANKLAEFRSEGITDFILDLRYNGGGSIMSAINLASAIVPQRTTDKVLIQSEYNADLQKALIEYYGPDAMKDYFSDKIYISNTKSHPIPELNINKLYVLVTGNSASASELVINGLTPYMPITLIGQTTYGKNVGSISIYEKENENNKWGLQPIVVKTYNSKKESEYANGFDPTINIQELEYDLKPLGDPNEIMLATAIEQITGVRRASAKNEKQISIIKGASTLENKDNAYQMFIDKSKIKRLIQK